MNEDMRCMCTPQEYIGKLFDETQDGRLEIHYFPLLDQPYSTVYKMDWSQQDADNLVERYVALTTALTCIGSLHDRLSNEADRTACLSADEQKVWDTYVKPFDPFEVDEDTMAALQWRSETETLEEEEVALLERHYEWYVANSRRRLPFDRWCPARLINRAQRYEALVRLNAPRTVLA